jgi:two-component system sensor histidine kinase/response regulator
MNSNQLHLMNNLNPDNTGSFDNEVNCESFRVSVADAYQENKLDRNVKQRFNELKEINARLQKQVEEQSEKLAEVIATNAKFLSIIAHDLRSPFGAIIGVLELLKDSYQDYNRKEVEKYIRLATNSANGTLSLLDNLLAWTSAQNQATYFNPVKINVYSLITDEIENLSTSATHKLITLNHSVPPDLYLVADQQMVKTILRNLINNAIKYSFIGGEIMVSAAEAGQFVEITVEDNGIGMKHKAQKELFNKDEVHTTRGTNNEYGTGLGLILCKEFIEKHGGNIRIESEPGKGTKINFTLPYYI